jgi:hypothetical protein
LIEAAAETEPVRFTERSLTIATALINFDRQAKLTVCALEALLKNEKTSRDSPDLSLEILTSYSLIELCMGTEGDCHNSSKFQKPISGFTGVYRFSELLDQS